jgi:lysophospholipase L1-like esterase
MKKAVGLLLGLLLLLGCAPMLGGCGRSPAPSSLVILGDSIASGYPDGAHGFGAQLQRAFSLKGSAYKNLAVSGADSGDLLQLLSGQPAAVQSADVLVVSIGANDLLGPFVSDVNAALQSAGGTDASPQALASKPDTAKRLAAYWEDERVQARYVRSIQNFSDHFINAMAYLRKLNPKARIYVLTVYDPFDGLDGYGSLTGFSEKMVARINGVIEGDRTAGNYTVLDICAAFHGRTDALTNIRRLDVHPNRAGHDLIFRTVYKAIMGREYGGSAR